MGTKQPAAGFKFNTFQEIKSHSSILYNERMAILFYLLDMKSIELNTHYNVKLILEVRGVLKQIYKNIRMLIRNNPIMRATLNLETQHESIYITDLAFSIVDNMIEFCQKNEFTSKKIYIIVNELNKIETLIKDILQYFHYFIRPEFRQKPDLEIATETYKEIADKLTVTELQKIVGKNHMIDFEGLGTSRVALKQEIEYDETVDGNLDKDEDVEDDDNIIFEDEEQ